jgi:hypothetical protein
MGRIKFELEPGEAKVGKWTITYVPPTGGKFVGKLLITDRRILFAPQNPKQDLSLATAIDDFRVDGVRGYGTRNHWDGESLSISRADVRSVQKRRSGMMKQVVVTLADGKEFVFDYGVLSVDKLATTLEG